MSLSIPRFVVAAFTFGALSVVTRTTMADAPAGRYTFPAPGTVYDTKTKLTWQQTAPPGTYTWGAASDPSAAQHYCAALALNGAGWRVPTVKELQSIFDYSSRSGAIPIDPTAFPGAPAASFWSSTPVAGTADAWSVDFRGSSATKAAPASPFDVRCVR